MTRAEFIRKVRAIIASGTSATATPKLTSDGRITATAKVTIGAVDAPLGALYDSLQTTPPAPPAPPPPTTVDFYRAPQQVDRLLPTNPDLTVLAQQPTSVWLGNEWVPDPRARGAELAAAADGRTLLLTVYSIPGRDNGNYSAGGLGSPAAYKTWIEQLALGVGQAPAWYILEPDALGLISGLDATKRAERIDMLRHAVARLKSDHPNTRVYLDASMWVPPADMAALLQQCNTGLAGFSLNVSGYRPLAECVSWAQQVSAAAAKLPFVIDTSRNGMGTAGTEWCNPPGQGLGKKPTTAPGIPGCDALLWIKAPGESDGTCNGGPPAGQFWLARARELIRNARF